MMVFKVPPATPPTTSQEPFTAIGSLNLWTDYGASGSQ